MATREPGFTLAYRLSWALAILLFVASVGGLFVPGLYRDVPVWAAQSRGVNLVDLCIVLPTLVSSLLRSARGSLRAHMVWLGVLGYMLYNGVIFAFDIAFNPLFLVYVGLLSLSFLALVSLLNHFDVNHLRLRFSVGAPTRSVSLYLVVLAGVFFLAWMKDIIPAILANTTPTTIVQTKIPTNPVYVLDLGFLLPLYVFDAILLLRRQAKGFLLAGPLLIFSSLLGTSIISSGFFQYAIDRSVSLAVVPMFVLIVGVSLLLAIKLLRTLREEA